MKFETLHFFLGVLRQPQYVELTKSKGELSENMVNAARPQMKSGITLSQHPYLDKGNKAYQKAFTAQCLQLLYASNLQQSFVPQQDVSDESSTAAKQPLQSLSPILSYQCKSGEDRTGSAIAWKMTVELLKKGLNLTKYDFISLFTDNIEKKMEHLTAWKDMSGTVASYSTKKRVPDDCLKFLRFAEIYTTHLDTLCKGVHNKSRSWETKKSKLHFVALKVGSHPIAKTLYKCHAQSPLSLYKEGVTLQKKGDRQRPRSAKVRNKLSTTTVLEMLFDPNVHINSAISKEVSEQTCDVQFGEDNFTIHKDTKYGIYGVQVSTTGKPKHRRRSSSLLFQKTTAANPQMEDLEFLQTTTPYFPASSESLREDEEKVKKLVGNILLLGKEEITIDVGKAPIIKCGVSKSSTLEEPRCYFMSLSRTTNISVTLKPNGGLECYDIIKKERIPFDDAKEALTSFLPEPSTEAKAVSSDKTSEFIEQVCDINALYVATSPKKSHKKHRRTASMLSMKQTVVDSKPTLLMGSQKFQHHRLSEIFKGLEKLENQNIVTLKNLSGMQLYPTSVTWSFTETSTGTDAQKIITFNSKTCAFSIIKNEKTGTLEIKDNVERKKINPEQRELYLQQIEHFLSLKQCREKQQPDQPFTCEPFSVPVINKGLVMPARWVVNQTGATAKMHYHDRRGKQQDRRATIRTEKLQDLRETINLCINLSYHFN